MFSYITLEGRDGVPVTLHGADQPNRKINDAPGLAGGVKSRRNTRPRPYGHGSIDSSRYAEGKLPALGGYVRGTTEELAWAQWAQISPALTACLDTYRTLRWRQGTTGVELQAEVKLVQIDGPDPKPEEPRVLRYQAQFESKDYRAFGQTLSTVVGNELSADAGGDTFPDRFPDTFTSSSGGDLTVVVGGTAPTPPTYRIRGGCADPRIRCDALGIEIVCNVELGTTDYVDIDVATASVLLNGIALHPEYIDYAASSAERWSDIPPGSWPFRLLAPVFDTTARLDIFTRNAHC
jgi:hypothetical protein